MKNLDKELKKQCTLARSCLSKKKFDTLELALKTGNRCYNCKFCKKWHTTSTQAIRKY